MAQTWWQRLRRSFFAPEAASRPVACRRQAAPRKKGFHPRLEELETRAVPALLPVGVLGTDGSPSDVATADLDNDGNRDFVVASQLDDTVNVFLGNGDGTFQVAKAFAAGNSPVAVAVGDFDDDGNRDLGVANSQDGVSVLFGNGDGTFDAPLDFQTGINVGDIAAADFNGDGYNDLAATVSGSQSVKVLFYTGGPNQFVIVSYDVEHVPSGLAVADFNDDGAPDLAVARYGQDDVAVLLNNGGGGFPSKMLFAVGDGPSSVAARDFNDDDQVDLAVTNFNGGTVCILMGNGAGGFAAAKHFPAGVKPDAVVAADFTGVVLFTSGVPDLVVTNRDHDTLTLLVGDGAGNFAAPFAIAVGDQPSAAAVADFDEDFRADLVATNRSGNTVTLLRGVAEPANVTSLFKIRRLGFVEDGTRWRFRLSLRNLSGEPLDDLKLIVPIKNQAKLLKASGITQTAAPGQPYRNLPALGPGKKINLVLVFKAKHKPKFGQLVYRAPGGL